jgi:hypothetical protein
MSRSGFTNSSNFSILNLEHLPTYIRFDGKKGKLALCALALDKQLNNVDFPTLGNPTILLSYVVAIYFNEIISLKLYVVI